MDILQRAINNGFSSTPSKEDIKKITNYLKGTKIPNKQPASLEHLAIQCVLVNRHVFRVPSLNFFAGSKNPFEILSRGPVEKLLSEATDTKMIPPATRTDKQCLILQLLNSQVTEFDSRRLQGYDKMSSGDAMFFRHMLNNCPKIKKAYVVPSIWRNFTILPRVEHQELLSVMATCWPNLTSLSLDITAKAFRSDDSLSSSGMNTFETICNTLPNLSFLDVTFDKNEPIKEKDCEMLAKMNHLKILHLRCATADANIAKIVARAAGQVPFLERFSFSCKKSLSVTFLHQSSFFIDHYSQLYPHKNLILEKHSLNLNMSGKWPSCLSVEELTLSGDNFSFDMSGCCSVRSLKISASISMDQVKSLLQHMGANLSSLTLVAKPVDLISVLSLCPRLRELTIETSKSVDESVVNKLKASQLSQLSVFKYGNSRLEFEADPSATKLYTMFFLNCRTEFETYKVQNISELVAIVQVLQEEEHTCFDKLKSIELHCNPRGGAEKDAFKLMGLLMLRSPFLKRVGVASTQYHGLRVPDWCKKVMTDVGVDCVPAFRQIGSDWDDDDDDDDEDESSDDASDEVENEEFGFSYDSDGNPTFEDIQSYLMWRDTWE